MKKKVIEVKKGYLCEFRYVKERMMDVIQEYFVCDDCECKDFKLIYNFSLKFHNINFSDDLIYDRKVDKIYQCLNCNRTYSTTQVEERLQKIKAKYKKTDLG